MKPARILLAHPDARLLSACQGSLPRDRYAVTTAASGLECLSHLLALSPDVLLLDLDLLWGGADGVLAWLNERPDRSRCPLVIVSSRSVCFRPLETSTPVVATLSGALAPDTIVEALDWVVENHCPNPEHVLTCDGPNAWPDERGRP